MNIIKLANRIDLYLDVTRNARFQRIEYDNAINDAIRQFIDEIIEKGFQNEQVISDNLYTLQATQTAAPTADVALIPTATYYHLTSLYATIGGTQYYCRPTTENKRGPLLRDTYRAPSDTKPYYYPVPTGFKVLHGSGTVSSCELNYIKIPATVSIGKESQLINSGSGVLTTPTSYTVTQPAEHNLVSYNIGDVFTSANTNLASGQVILTSALTDCDLPAKVHEIIAKKSAALLSGAVQNYNPSAFAEKEAEKP